MADLIIPRASVLEVIVVANKLAFNRGQILTGRLVEQKIGGTIVVSSKAASEHPEFSVLLDRIRDAVRPRVENKGEPEPVDAVNQSAWCHYHKATVGHTIDSCPDVRCRKCRAQGHTDRVCQAEPCEVCGKFGHTANGCRKSKCDECGKDGHTSEKCYSKVTCEKCGNKGHLAEKCRSTSETPKPVWCTFCQIEGDHPTSGCEDLKYWECENCGEKGHFFKNCRNQHIIHPQRVEKIEVPSESQFIVASGNAQPLQPRKFKK